MLTIFNRCELCLTISQRAQSEVRKILQQHDIEYSLKTVDETPNHGNRIRTSARKQPILIYTFYVNKKQYDTAKHLIAPISLTD